MPDQEATKSNTTPIRPDMLHLDLDWVLSAPTSDGNGYICGWAFASREEGEETMREIGRLFNSCMDMLRSNASTLES